MGCDCSYFGFSRGWIVSFDELGEKKSKRESGVKDTARITKARSLASKKTGDFRAQCEIIVGENKEMARREKNWIRPGFTDGWVYWPQIEYYAKHLDLEVPLIAATIAVESLGNTFAYRYEPNYKWLYGSDDTKEFARIGGMTVETNLVCQKSSYGLMQVMGGVFYEYQGHQFEKTPLTMLLPEVGLKYGCIHLKAKQQKYGEDAAHTYAAYNAGSVQKTSGGMFFNQKNVDRFDHFYRSFFNF